jgi:hypothetical protein
MAGYERRSEKRQIAVDDVQVGATHAASANAQEHLAGLYDGQRPQLLDELRARLMQAHAFGSSRAHTAN